MRGRKKRGKMAVAGARASFLFVFWSLASNASRAQE